MKNGKLTFKQRRVVGERVIRVHSSVEAYVLHIVLWSSPEWVIHLNLLRLAIVLRLWAVTDWYLVALLLQLASRGHWGCLVLERVRA